MILNESPPGKRITSLYLELGEENRKSEPIKKKNIAN